MGGVERARSLAATPRLLTWKFRLSSLAAAEACSAGGGISAGLSHVGFFVFFSYTPPTFHGPLSGPSGVCFCLSSSSYNSHHITSLWCDVKVTLPPCPGPNQTEPPLHTPHPRPLARRRAGSHSAAYTCEHAITTSHMRHLKATFALRCASSPLPISPSRVQHA